MSELVIVKARVKPQLRDKSAEILEDLGCDTSTAIRMMLSYVVRTGRLPIMDQPYILNVPEGTAQDIKDLMKKGGAAVIMETRNSKETKNEECIIESTNDLCDHDVDGDSNVVPDN